MNFVLFRKIHFSKAILSACAFVSVLGIAQGATYYVSTTGSDSNPGTESAPFASVSVGVAAAQPGDTVIVENGTYGNEGVVASTGSGDSVVNMNNAGTSGNPITIEAQNRGEAILNAASTTTGPLGCAGAWSYFDLSNTAYVVVQGFVLENSCVNGFHINGSAHDITLRWNTVENIGNWNNPAATLSPSGMYLADTEYNITVDGNIFTNIGGGSNVNQQHAIYTAASDVTIVNNIFYNNVHGWDIQTAGGTNITIANNTFAFPNPSRDGQIILWDGGNVNSLSNVVIQNNVFYEPQGYGVIADLSGGSINGCTMQTNLTTVGTLFDDGASGSVSVSCTQTSNLTSTDPNFVNDSTAPYDFHLNQGSPAIDTGTNNSYTVVDFDDWVRPVNVIYDRGAYEWHSSSTTTTTATPTIALSASPSSLSVTAGGTGSSSLTVTVTGSASPAFSASGLPSGVTASFSPSSCSASCTTTLTFTAASSAAQASANVSVTAASSGATSGTASIALTVNAASTTTTTTPPPTTTTTPPPTTTSSGSGDYTTGLVGEWKLLGNLTDSINGDNGSLHGGGKFAASPSLLSGSNDLALYLNGTNGYVSIPEESQLDMITNLSVSFWIYADASPTGDEGQRIVAKVYDWDIKLNSVYPQFTSGSNYAMANYSVPLYTWTHVVFTYSTGQVTAYINGQQVSLAANTFTSGTPLPTYADGIYLGTDSSISDFYSGSISDVRIYNRVLAPADVQALYTARASAIQ